MGPGGFEPPSSGISEVGCDMYAISSSPPSSPKPNDLSRLTYRPLGILRKRVLNIYLEC